MTKQRYGNELHPLYSRWLSMTQRCTNPNNVNYKNYGAKGISIAEDLKSFEDYCAYDNEGNINLAESISQKKRKLPL